MSDVNNNTVNADSDKSPLFDHSDSPLLGTYEVKNYVFKDGVSSPVVVRYEYVPTNLFSGSVLYRSNQRDVSMKSSDEKDDAVPVLLSGFKPFVYEPEALFFDDNIATHIHSGWSCSMGCVYGTFLDYLKPDERQEFLMRQPDTYSKLRPVEQVALLRTWRYYNQK